MTQTLQFEAAWEKQVSPQDRQLIEACFQQAKNGKGNNSSLDYVRHDYNHRQALLVLVLMHNEQKEAMTFTAKQLYCFNQAEKQIATKEFTLPFTIPAETSMPWTFIFPKNTYEHVDVKSELSLKI